MAIQALYPCLWFDGIAGEAAEYYCGIFPDSRITEQNAVVVMFEINKAKFMALNGGNQFRFNESVSFVITCDTQEEINYYWDRLTEEGQESRCGWLKDKYGVSWQVVPAMLGQWMSDPEKGQRVASALMNMQKLEIDKLINA